MTLEESFGLYQEGMGLLKLCNENMDHVEKQMLVLNGEEKWMNFKETLAEKTVHAEDVLTKYLPEEKGYQKKVIESMNYSVLAGGERLRPILMEESFRLFGGTCAICWSLLWRRWK